MNILGSTDEMMAAVAMSKHKLLEAKLAQLEVDAASQADRKKNDAVTSRMSLMSACENVLEKHPTWSREKLLKFFPEFEEIVDAVMEE